MSAQPLMVELKDVEDARRDAEDPLTTARALTDSGVVYSCCGRLAAKQEMPRMPTKDIPEELPIEFRLEHMRHSVFKKAAKSNLAAGPKKKILRLTQAAPL